MKILSLSILGFATAQMFSCSSPNGEAKFPEGVGVNRLFMDTTIRPSDDFFQFVNGGWMKQNEIPADLGSYSSFTELREDTQGILLDILKRAGENEQYKEGSDQRKAVEFL